MNIDLNECVNDVVNEYKKNPRLCSGISNIRTVCTGFNWWKDMGLELAQVAVKTHEKDSLKVYF